jgi:hypothetical protein
MVFTGGTAVAGDGFRNSFKFARNHLQSLPKRTICGSLGILTLSLSFTSMKKMMSRCMFGPASTVTTETSCCWLVEASEQAEMCKSISIQ